MQKSERKGGVQTPPLQEGQAPSLTQQQDISYHSGSARATSPGLWTRVIKQPFLVVPRIFLATSQPVCSHAQLKLMGALLVYAIYIIQCVMTLGALGYLTWPPSAGMNLPCSCAMCPSLVQVSHAPPSLQKEQVPWKRNTCIIQAATQHQQILENSSIDLILTQFPIPRMW